MKMEHDELRRMKRLFRILKSWRISYCSTSEYSGQCSISPMRKAATVYHWGNDNSPKDYVFHELLHIALKAYRREKFNSKSMRKIEEEFVQDICKVAKLTFERKKKRL